MRYRVEDYIAFLVRHGFNGVRIPLSVPSLLYHASERLGQDCGQYKGMPMLYALDDIVRKLASAGIFVALDMHTITGNSHNDDLWCIPPRSMGWGSRRCSVGTPGSRDSATEQPLIAAWTVLARRYCSHANVLMADIFNEPHGRAQWGVYESPLYYDYQSYDAGTDWRAAAMRIGDSVLS